MSSNVSTRPIPTNGFFRVSCDADGMDVEPLFMSEFPGRSHGCVRGGPYMPTTFCSGSSCPRGSPPGPYAVSG
eukprot:1738865-Heterocapsa_arctica.AAC.1